MAKRKSQYSLAKKGKVGRKPFEPPIVEWTEACRLYPYDKQIFKHFDINAETFYGFLDKQRCLEEAGKKSDYLEAYKSGRNKSRTLALENLQRLAQFGGKAENGDSACAIFIAKTYGGLIESVDLKHIDIKKKELELKTKSFLTQLADKFNLNPAELEKFAAKYFKPVEEND